MMVSPSIDELLKNVKYSRYTLVSVAAKRAREINDAGKSEGAMANRKAVSIALKEIATQKVRFITERNK